VAFFGITLILYDLLATWSGSRWSLLDSIATYVSTLLTLLGTICTAVSIYFYSEQMAPPEKMSAFVTAPIIIGACLLAIVYFFWAGHLPGQIVNGFALIAIAGALLRFQPHPVKDSNLFWSRKPHAKLPDGGADAA
jgi:surface polysaccharide O-acyltransferase-like enzyme